jgi:hypothetical protein
MTGIELQHITLLEKFVRVQRHQIPIQIIMSSFEGYYILFSKYDEKQNCYARDLAEHTEIFFHKVVYSRY